MAEKAPTIDAALKGFAIFAKSNPNLPVILKSFFVGDPVGLIREPENPYDSNAVIVINRDEVGFAYIQREKAAILTKWMDSGWVYSCRVIRPPLLKSRKEGSLTYHSVKNDSFLVRCTPIQPIALKKKTVQSIPFTSNKRIKGFIDG